MLLQRFDQGEDIAGLRACIMLHKEVLHPVIVLLQTHNDSALEEATRHLQLAFTRSALS